ncbi:MAG: NfeD family protein [Acidobacteriia bacterium]|nr:NfeD family protein [Terriglobia bacterium]
MTTFYLICFVVGFALTIVSLVMGHLNLHLHLHSFDASAHGLNHGLGHLHHGLSTGGEFDISPVNFSTVMAFLTWFGGMGYLLSHYYRFWLLLGLTVATLSGLAGGAVVFVFMAKFLAPRQTQLDPADFDLIGTLARISSPIRPQGTGEIIFSQAGARKTSGARSVDGTGLEKGTEVVITRYEKGIAYVQRWEEFTK